ADPNEGTPPCTSPLAWAISRSHDDLADWILRHYGPGPDGGASALTAASIHGHLEMMRRLLDSGVGPDVRSWHNRTPLIQAAWYGQEEAVRLLLERGAEVNAQAPPCRTALSMAAGVGRTRTVRLLLDHGAKDLEDGLFAALGGSHKATALLLLDAGADPNALLPSGTTALMAAAMHADPDLVEALLQRGAAPDAVDAQGRTALDWAERLGRGENAAIVKCDA